MSDTRPGQLMKVEIAEQPAVLQGMLDRLPSFAKELSSILPERPRGVVLVARGSSRHAATYWRYVIEIGAGIPTALFAPSVASLYRASPSYDGWLCVALSQSGRTQEIVDAAAAIGAAGATVLSVTNDGASPLAEVAQLLWPLDGGRERAVPATKTVTAQFISAFGALEAFGGHPPRDLALLPSFVEAVTRDRRSIAGAAHTLASAASLVVLGRGISCAAAQEAALKIKETTGVPTEAYSAAEFQHGPIATVRPGVTVLAIDAGGPAHRSIEATVALVRERGGDVVEMSNREHAEVSLPAASEELRTIVAVVRAQQLAHAMADVLGHDADTGIGLAKVTQTM
jgi:glutamine---fructose-6-phosphate transaminase (isomerizing)